MPPRAAEVELDCRKGDVNMYMFTDEAGKGGLSICYSEERKEITVDRSSMQIRFNEKEGESRTRPLENGLCFLRQIYVRLRGDGARRRMGLH